MNGNESAMLVLFFVCVIIAIVTHSAGLGALEDPNNKNVVYLDQLDQVAALSGVGTWMVTIYRQSGNVHSQKRVTGHAAVAMSAVTSTFRRAKIGEISIKSNSVDRLEIVRLFHNHRGSNEGKKVGGALIVREG